jgi:hypothetical protein
VDYASISAGRQDGMAAGGGFWNPGAHPGVAGHDLNDGGQQLGDRERLGQRDLNLQPGIFFNSAAVNVPDTMMTGSTMRAAWR